METDEVVIPKLTVKTLSDRSIPIDLDSSVQTIGDVKRVVEQKVEFLPAGKQMMISMGRPLLDHEPVPAADSTIYLFYYEPTALIADPIEVATEWDTKNRLKVFKGLYLVSQRNFREAARLLVEALGTFSDAGFITFKECVLYAVISAMLVFDRPKLLGEVIRSSEVLEVIHDLGEVEPLVNSFYNCRYGEYFAALASVEGQMRGSWLLGEHTQYIVKEMRIRAYSQILQSYRSLTLYSMAQSFGVTVDFIDRELSRFIAAGRLNCVIDKVNGVVITSPPDKRNGEYLGLIKNGDVLLAKMQKLGRILSY